MATKVIGPIAPKNDGPAHGWDNSFDSQMGAPGKDIPAGQKSGTPKTDHSGRK